MIKLAIGIPNYNHGSTIAALLSRLAPYHLPCILVDDGSDTYNKALIQEAIALYPWVTLITLAQNQGKGGAMQAALAYADAHAYTHLLQIDADGQHDTDDIPQFIATVTQRPLALVTGIPRYDASIPKGRLYGRKITDFWVMVETLSTDIKDAMCGFRVYPVAATMAILHQATVGKRMDFDIEILVRLHWHGTPILSIPTQVSYPPHGISHFRLWQDNWRISTLHTRLFLGMLYRLPALLRRKILLYRSKQTSHPWYQIRETGTLLGLKCMLWVYLLLGKRVAYLLLYPITYYFYLTQSRARAASQLYLTQLIINQPAMTDRPLSPFKHMLSFSQAIVDKLSVWCGQITLRDITFHGADLLNAQIAKKQGGIIFTAHLGNIEIARALSRLIPDIKVNALVFIRHAANINRMLHKVNPAYQLNMIEVQTIDLPLAIQLKAKVDAGEFIVIAADRIAAATHERTLTATFLGKPARFPQGAFTLASILQCPSYVMFCMKEKTGQFSLFFDNFADPINRDKSQADDGLAVYAQAYADLLSLFCIKHPLQWFNFYNFWMK